MKQDSKYAMHDLETRLWLRGPFRLAVTLFGFFPPRSTTRRADPPGADTSPLHITDTGFVTVTLLP